MTTTTIPYRFVVKRDTAANFTAANTLLLKGEWALETDTKRLKIGDGTTAWSALPYMVPDILHGATSKTTPANADEIPLIDSAASNSLKKLTWTNLKATLKAYFDTLYASSSGSAWTTIKKTADETRASTVTLVDDTFLKFAATAGVRYRIKASVFYTIANATMDFKYSAAYSGTFSGDMTLRRQQAPVSGIGSDNEFTSMSAGIINASIGQTGAVAGNGYVILDIIFVATTSGTFSFQWAQNTSDAGNLTVLAGSYLEYMSS